MAQENGVEYVDITPNWEQVASMARLLPDMSIEGRRALVGELVRMGQVADMGIVAIKLLRMVFSDGPDKWGYGAASNAMNDEIRALVYEFLDGK